MHTDFLRAAFRPNGPVRTGASWRGDMRVLAECLGLGAAGFAATALLNAASFTVPAAVGVGIGLAAAMALKVSRDHAREIAAKLYGRPEHLALLEDLRARTRGTVAARRGDAWVVFRPGQGVEVMDEAAYRDFRGKAPRLDEVVASGDDVRVTRLSLGKPYGDLDDAPTLERFDLRTGRSVERGWVVDGETLDAEAAEWRREARAEAAEDGGNVVSLFRR